MKHGSDVLIGRTIRHRRPMDPLRPNNTPFTAEELNRFERQINSELFSRALATVRQRDQIIANMSTCCEPAGAHRELVELRDLVGQLVAKIEEMKGGEQ